MEGDVTCKSCFVVHGGMEGVMVQTGWYLLAVVSLTGNNGKTQPPGLVRCICHPNLYNGVFCCYPKEGWIWTGVNVLTQESASCDFHLEIYLNLCCQNLNFFLIFLLKWDPSGPSLFPPKFKRKWCYYSAFPETERWAISVVYLDTVEAGLIHSNSEDKYCECS